MVAVLVQAGGEADRVGEGQAHGFYRIAANLAAKQAGQLQAIRGIQQRQGGFVRGFGIGAEQQGA
ncbi:hypothetical protein D3C85_1911740 [compost metagenome]